MRISPTSRAPWFWIQVLMLFLVWQGGLLHAAGPGRIAYVADRDIFLMNADGTNKQSLGVLAAGGQAFDVSLSGDEAWVAYTGFDSSFQTGLLVARAEPIGPSNTPIFISAAINNYRTCWHPKGQWLAFTGYDASVTPQVFLVRVFDDNGNLTGAAPAQLTTNGGVGLWHGDAAFSPDGQHVAISRFRSEIIITQAFDAEGNRNSTVVSTPVSAVTSIVSGQAAWPCFNPDGKKLVFRHVSPDGMQYSIAMLTVRNASNVLTPEGTSNPRLQMTTPSTDVVAHPTWSQDGTKLAFMEQITFTRIHTLNASAAENATTNPRVLVAGVSGSDTNCPSFPQQGGAAPVVYTINPPPNLVSWWTAENAAWDIAGIGRGTMHNADNFNANAYGPGKVGRAFLFDGVDDHVQGRPTGMSLVSNFTIEGWIKPVEARAGDMMILSKQNDDEQNVSYSLMLRNNLLTFRANMAGVEHVLTAVGTSIPLNQWTHVAFTESAENSRLRLFVNGNEVMITAAVPPRPTTTGPLCIGAAVSTAHAADAPSAPFAGLIDELSLYNRALSSTELQLIVQAGAGGKDFHDPARDFSPTANPNQPWKYGWLQGGAIDPAFLDDTDPLNGALFPPPAALEGTTHVYRTGEVEDFSELLFNSSPTQRASFTGDNASLIDLSPRQIALVPSTTGEHAVLRWTAPENGRYAISATFTGVENTPSTTTVNIYHGAASLFSGTVDSFLGEGVSFTDDVQLTAGDKVDWIVSSGTGNANDHTGLVASVAFLEPFSDFQSPTLESITFKPPLMAGKGVTFLARNGSKIDNPTMTAKLQFSATPGDPGSWVDLPGGAMPSSTSLSFLLSLSNLPAGTYALRVATEVPGLGTTFSTPSETLTVLPAGPFYEIQTVATPVSDPTGQTTHRGDTITYTVRFRNTGGAAVQPSQNLALKLRLPDAVYTSGTPAGAKVTYDNANTYVTWPIIRTLNPIDAVLPFTTVFSSDLFSSPNHGFEDGDLVTVAQAAGGALPQGLTEGTVYKIISSTSNGFKLTLPGSTTVINLLSNGTGANTVKRAADVPLPFTVATSTDTITCKGHRLAVGDRIRVANTGGSLPGGMVADQNYGVSKITADTFQINKDSRPVDITSGGTGTQTFVRFDNRVTDEIWQTRTVTATVYTPPGKAFQVDKTKDTVVLSGHGYLAGHMIEFAPSGLPRPVPLPGGLAMGLPYKVATPTTTGFKLLNGDTPVDIGSYGDAAKTQVPVLDATLDEAFNRVGDLVQASTAITQTVNKVTTTVGTSAATATQLINPLRLTAETTPDSQFKQGGIIRIDLTVKNEGSVTGTGILGVRAPAGLTIMGTGASPVFVDADGITGGPPIDPVTKKSAAAYATGKYNPSLETDADYNQQVYFSIGNMLPGTSQRCRVSFRVQYDLNLTTTPSIQFTQAVAALYPGKGPKVIMRPLETPLDLPINPAGVNDAKPFLVLRSTQFGFTTSPDNINVELVAQDTKTLPNSNPKRNFNNIVYRMTYENTGNIEAEFIRLIVAVPANTTYVANSAAVSSALGDTIKPSAPLQIGSLLVFDVPYLETKGVLGSTKTLEFIVKLNSGVALGTTITQLGGVLTSRDLATPVTHLNPLQAVVASPAFMDYENTYTPVVITQAGGTITSPGYSETIFYVNRGGMAASGAGLRYTLPAGVTFSRADFVIPNSTFSQYKPTAAAGRTITLPASPTAGHVIFNLGKVPAGAYGWVRVTLEQNSATVPKTGYGAYDLPAIIQPFDSLNPLPPPPPQPGTKSKAGDTPTPSLLAALRSNAEYLDPTNPRPYVSIQGPPAVVSGSHLNYKITFGNQGPGENVQGGIFVHVPEGAEFVSANVEAVYPTDQFPATLVVNATDRTTTFGPYDGSYYTSAELGNVHGGRVFEFNKVPEGSSYILNFSVRDNGNMNTERVLEVTAFIGGIVRKSRSAPCFVVDPSDPPDTQQERIHLSQMGGPLATQALGTAGKPNTRFTVIKDKLGLTSQTISIIGTDFVQVAGNAAVIWSTGANRIVAAGGGNLIGGDGASIIQGTGAAIVAGGGGNIVAAGGGNLINVDVPGTGPNSGRMTVSQLYANLPAIVAAGGGNIVAGGGMNLVRPAGVLSHNGNALVGLDGASLVGLDGASLVGLDGASILATLKSNLTGGYSMVTPAGVTFKLNSNLASIAIAQVVATDGAGVVATDGAGIVAGGGGNIFSTSQPMFFNANSIVAAGGGNVIKPGIVAAGGGNIVAAGGGNVVKVQQ